MTWSSSSGGVRREGDRMAMNASATKWSWIDLDATGPEAEAREREAAHHMHEVEEAYRRGRAEGEEAGLQTARNELQVAMRTTLQALEDVRANREAWNARLEEHLVALAAAMATKVIERTREEDPSVFVDLARQAVAAFPIEEAVRIRVHPADKEILTDEELLDQVIGPRTVKWIPDPEIAQGGCIVEGPDKIIDGRVDEAIARIARALIDG